MGIGAGFAGIGARMCWEVMARGGIIRRSRQNSLRRGGVPCPDGRLFLVLLAEAFFVYAVKFLLQMRHPFYHQSKESMARVKPHSHL